jgi:hypothetical protein
MEPAITRRELAALAALSPFAAAQTAAPDEVEQMRQQYRRSAAALDKFELAMATEPAVIFRA